MTQTYADLTTTIRQRFKRLWLKTLFWYIDAVTIDNSTAEDKGPESNVNISKSWQKTQNLTESCHNRRIM